jgi:glycine dehydrogenase subunit 2
MNTTEKYTSCGPQMEEPTVFEQSSPGRCGFFFGAVDVPLLEPRSLFGAVARSLPPELPELSEVDVTRHFTRLSTENYSKDVGLYPLGSCTMKYNPKIANKAVALEGFAETHPYQDQSTVQGNLELLCDLQRYLADICGMEAVTLWPAAGSHGELTGMLMIRAYHTSKGNPRKKVLIPDSAHGTNPASAAICNYEIVVVKSDGCGLVDPDEVARHMDEDVAAIMITNPNTLGIFETNFKKVADIVHSKGGLVYCDGANLNALMGYVRMGEIGCDVMHMNLHKTFATPHGGGGPGAGPVGVGKTLEPFLPTPIVVKSGNSYALEYERPKSIGRMKSFFGTSASLSGPTHISRSSEPTASGRRRGSPF